MKSTTENLQTRRRRSPRKRSPLAIPKQKRGTLASTKRSWPQGRFERCLQKPTYEGRSSINNWLNTSLIKPDVTGATRGAPKCRIPQRLPAAVRPPTNTISAPRPRNGFTEPATVRPKSTSRLKEEFYVNKVKQGPRPVKPNERLYPGTKPQTMLPKKSTNHDCPSPKSVIRVPMAHEEDSNISDKELREMSPTHGVEVKSGRESIRNRNKNLNELKLIWQENMIKFEKMKADLNCLQKDILCVYASMREIHHEMGVLGGSACLPPVEELRVMNVANLTPDQLLQLCAGDDTHHCNVNKIPLSFDLNKFYEAPTKLVKACEQTLVKRKEVIDWFETLKSHEKGISVNKLSTKINEFNAENEVLQCSLENSKSAFLKELEGIVRYLRKSMNDTMATQVRMEELTLEMSQLNAQNTDLKKQIHNNENHLRSHVSRARLEELERELKEEKCKRLFMKDRLTRAEGQAKLNLERAAQLEATLEQARSQVWSLERTVQQLNEQNHKLQTDFDTELSKLTESIKEHTEHLEQIAEAREKLQAEKEDLENHLSELNAHYNESLQNMKIEMASNVAKVLDTEKKCEIMAEEKKKLELKLEVICNQLLEAELKNKAAQQELIDKQALLEKESVASKDLENFKRELETANTIISEYRQKVEQQDETIKETNWRLREAEDNIEACKNELSLKNKQIAEIEASRQSLKRQLQENESQMAYYMEQLASLKHHIQQLQQDFGNFEDLNELREMLKQQRAELLEATRQNSDLAEAVQKTEKEIEQCNENLYENEQLLLERDGIIKMLSEKEQEQSNIIKILKNNLEQLNQQLEEKNTEIKSLLVNLETRKQQISNMEKIILTLEDQTRKVSLQRKKDQDYIQVLQNKVAEYESSQAENIRIVDNAENLDSLIKKLEDEIGSPLENDMLIKEHSIRRRTHGNRNSDSFNYHKNLNLYVVDPASVSNTSTVFNSVNKKKLNISDNFDRKKVSNIDTKRLITPAIKTIQAPVSSKESVQRTVLCPKPNPQCTRNLQYLSTDLKSNRKTKMFKLTSHKM